MLILKSNDRVCPNCGDSGAPIKQRTEGKPEKICMSCGHFWHPTTDGMQGTKVRVIEPMSIWKGMIGVVKEILPTTGRNVRIQFLPSKYDTFADLFHPAHLEQV